MKFLAPLTRTEVYETPETEMLALTRIGENFGEQSVEEIVPVAFVPEPAGHDRHNKPLVARRFGLNVFRGHIFRGASPGQWYPDGHCAHSGKLPVEYFPGGHV